MALDLQGDWRVGSWVASSRGLQFSVTGGTSDVQDVDKMLVTGLVGVSFLTQQVSGLRHCIAARTSQPRCGTCFFPSHW